ncbi:hypothetical protein EX30DRAFT_342016 [Ascodesmis nigricans]|uniref:Uncharacterized protein n=1 Tax=Ascodesmis nigricans TaxID=341454 RepID=A0A4S2MTY1_9PEZI|nr:hypothetical protein EX30DRAFT_342016 [Ascodesmis nigricans]
MKATPDHQARPCKPKSRGKKSSLKREQAQAKGRIQRPYVPWTLQHALPHGVPNPLHRVGEEIDRLHGKGAFKDVLLRFDQKTIHEEKIMACLTGHYPPGMSKEEKKEIRRLLDPNPILDSMMMAYPDQILLYTDKDQPHIENQRYMIGSEPRFYQLPVSGWKIRDGSPTDRVHVAAAATTIAEAGVDDQDHWPAKFGDWKEDQLQKLLVKLMGYIFPDPEFLPVILCRIPVSEEEGKNGLHLQEAEHLALRTASMAKDRPPEMGLREPQPIESESDEMEFFNPDQITAWMKREDARRQQQQQGPLAPPRLSASPWYTARQHRKAVFQSPVDQPAQETVEDAPSPASTSQPISYTKLVDTTIYEKWVPVPICITPNPQHFVEQRRKAFWRPPMPGFDGSAMPPSDTAEPEYSVEHLSEITNMLQENDLRCWQVVETTRMTYPFGDPNPQSMSSNFKKSSNGKETLHTYRTPRWHLIIAAPDFLRTHYNARPWKTMVNEFLEISGKIMHHATRGWSEDMKTQLPSMTDKARTEIAKQDLFLDRHPFHSFECTGETPIWKIRELEETAFVRPNDLQKLAWNIAKEVWDYRGDRRRGSFPVNIRETAADLSPEELHMMEEAHLFADFRAGHDESDNDAGLCYPDHTFNIVSRSYKWPRSRLAGKFGRQVVPKREHALSPQPWTPSNPLPPASYMARCDAEESYYFDNEHVSYTQPQPYLAAPVAATEHDVDVNKDDFLEDYEDEQSHDEEAEDGGNCTGGGPNLGLEEYGHGVDLAEARRQLANLRFLGLGRGE